MIIWRVVIFIFFVFAPFTAGAETIYLKDGRVVKGEIFNEGPYYTTVREGGVPRRYYKEQILRIEKDHEEYDYDVSKVNVDPSQFADISEEKVKLIITLMEVTGTRQSMQTNIDHIIAQAPEEKRLELEKIFDINDIVGQLVPIYDRHYTENELKEIIGFYRTSAGKKMIEATPEIMKEAMKTSVEYLQQKSNQ